MRIGELARSAGLATSALRYYEEAGLLPPAQRSAAGYRLYGDDARGRLSFIRRAQALGLSVSEIRALIDGPRGDSAADRSRLRHVVAHKLAETERRVSELADLKTELESLYLRLGQAQVPVCGHVGDCECWLPTQEEVMAMTAEVQVVQACDCSGCSDPDCDCGCDCCKVSV